MGCIVNVISDSNIGGAGRILLAYLGHRDRFRFDTTVVLPVGSLLREPLDALSVPYVEVTGLAERSFNPSAVMALRRTLKSLKPDIVHTHAAMSARIAARLIPGVKVVYTRHSVFPNKKSQTVFPRKQVFGAIDNFFADKIIAVSPAAMDNIVETGTNAKKITVIYNGVDPLPRLSAEAREQVRNGYGINKNAFLCGIFARLTPVKGQDYILEAAAILKDKPDIMFVIAGTGESSDALKQRVKAEKLTNVILPGFVKEPGPLMAALDVQLNASFGTEATSLSLIEGFSAGIPAIVTDFGGNPYVVANGVNGLVITQKDGKAMANAILSIYNDREFSKTLSQNAADTYVKRFTAESMARELEGLYETLMK